MDTTVRIKYTLSARPMLVDPTAIAAIFVPFGAMDESCIVLSLQPAPPKKPKRATALVPFARIESAFAAVCASGLAEHGLQDIEVTWAGRMEPESIGWLKRMGQLGETTRGKPLLSRGDQYSIRTPGLDISASDDTLSSFSSTFVRCLYFEIYTSKLTGPYVAGPRCYIPPATRTHRGPRVRLRIVHVDAHARGGAQTPRTRDSRARSSRKRLGMCIPMS